MNRYIDADKMYASYQEVCKGLPCMSCPFLNCEDNKCELESMILQQPIVDAVSVVRCKDCKWSVSLDGILGCRWHGFYETGSDWFCADAERRDDEWPYQQTGGNRCDISN